jgi:hypothetical protein
MDLIILYVTLNIIAQNGIVPKPDICTGTCTQVILRVCYLRSFSIFDETYHFVVGVICPQCRFSELQKHSQRDWNPGQYFGIAEFVHVNSPTEQRAFQQRRWFLATVKLPDLP